MRRIAILSAALFSACSGEARMPGVTLECWAYRCPLQSAVEATVQTFADDTRGFDVAEPLLIRWHADGALLAPREIEGDHELPQTIKPTIGQTLSEHEVLVTTHQVLLHELQHVHYWRTRGDADDDHRSGDGPWTAATDERLERLETRDRLDRCGTLEYERGADGGLLCLR